MDLAVLAQTRVCRKNLRAFLAFVVAARRPYLNGVLMHVHVLQEGALNTQHCKSV